MGKATLKFPRLTWFTGRNGSFKASGIEVLVSGSTVILTPLTSKWRMARCAIAVPHETLQGMVYALNSALAEINANELKTKKKNNDNKV